MRVGPYELGRQLGQGGMGAVFEARAQDGRAVALKILLKNDPERVARFQRESRLLASLGEADGFVPLVESGVTPAGAYLVMPLVPGGTLRDKLVRGPLGIDETIALGRALAAALGRAHAKGIVHRDVKPENVLFTADGRPLVTDLGLGKHWDPAAPGASQSISLSRHGIARGTAGYMAPEQLADAKTVGPPADVFALGAILYECLAGGPPFAAESFVELAAKVARGEHEPLRGRRPDAPSWLVASIERALAPAIEDRWADGVALARALATPARRSRGVVLVALLLVAGAIAGALLAVHARRPALAPATPAAPPAPPPRSRAAEVRALVEAGYSRIRANDVAGANVCAERALALDSRSGEAWDLSGVVRDAQGELDIALACANRAIELDPRLSVAWSNRSTYRARKGDVDGELADSAHAIELDPRNIYAWFQHAKGRGEKGDVAGEIAEETHALEIDPTFAEAFANRSAARLDQGDITGAIEDGARAVELRPDLRSGWMNRGIARVQKGDYVLAIADLTKGIDLDPTVGMAWLGRARARELSGDKEGAARDLETFLERFPNDPQVAVVRETLARYRAAK